MPRGLSTDIKAELAKDAIQFSDLVELHFTSLGSGYNPLRLTNCPIDIVTSTSTASSGTYAANGNMLSFDTITETGEAKVNQVNMNLSGASSTITNLFFNNDYVDRRVVIYRVFYDKNFTFIGSPVMLFDGEIQSYIVNETGSASQLSVTSASVFYDFERSNGRRTNETSQQAVFPADKGMEWSALTTDDISWGKPDA